MEVVLETALYVYLVFMELLSAFFLYQVLPGTVMNCGKVLEVRHGMAYT